MNSRIDKNNKRFRTTSDSYKLHIDNLDDARMNAEDSYAAVKRYKGRDAKKYDKAVESFRRDMGEYRRQMKKSRTEFGLSRGTYDETMAAKSKFYEDHNKTSEDLYNSLKGKREERRKAEQLSDSSDKKIQDIKDARRNLAIAGAVGLGAAGLGYGIYRWRKNREKKKEEEEKDKYPIPRN